MNRLKQIELFLLDMDGTFSLGETLIPGSDLFLRKVKETGRQVLFLTNNSSASAQTYSARFLKMGVEVDPEDILTSGGATAQVLASEGVTRVFLLGTPSLEYEFQRAGVELTSHNPEAVVLGYDKTLTYDKLKTACGLLRQGLPYVATHPDVNCPSPDFPLPDAGAFIAAIQASTGRSPDRVIGKPNPEFLAAAAAKRGVPISKTAMVGDRLYTDIACGLAAGALAILVLSGETTKEMAAESPHQPDLIMDDLAAMIPALDRISHQQA
jgi:HAD superfamily hydrolase (TIGR01450 family)